MAKRSKKKNPNLLTQQQREDILFNQNLDSQKKKWDFRLNLTLGIAVGVFVLVFLILPALNMNFSSTFSELLGAELGSEISDEEDVELGVTIDMSLLAFLTAGAGGYKDPVEYLASHTNSDINSSIMYDVFMKKITSADIKTLNSAYVLLLIVSIAALASWILLFATVCAKRKKNSDGIALLIGIAIFAAVSIVQWIIFLAVGIAASGKGQFQPHIASYLILCCGISAAAVYGVYRSKVKKLREQRRQVPDEAELGSTKG